MLFDEICWDDLQRQRAGHGRGLSNARGEDSQPELEIISIRVF